MRTRWLGTLLRGIASAAWVGLSSAAVAQPAEPVYQFQLPAQSAASALRLFGELTHQQIIFSESLVKGRRSAAVNGSFTAAQALDLLLARTGLKITRTEAGVFYIGSGTAAEKN